MLAGILSVSFKLHAIKLSDYFNTDEPSGYDIHGLMYVEVLYPSVF